MVFFSIVLFLIVVLVIGVDGVLNFIQWQSRIGIGRWNDYGNWKNKVNDVAEKWLFNTPTVKKKDNSKYVILDIIKGNYRNKTIQSWQSAGLLLGINDKSLKKKYIDSVINENGHWIVEPNQIDNAILAYAILKNSDDVNRIKPAMDKMLEVITSRKNSIGLIVYRKEDMKKVYVDTLGFICPFLVLYSKTYQMPELEEIAVYQLKYYTEHAMMKAHLLPFHAYDTERNIPLGVAGWGRGMGWHLLGLIDTYNELSNASIYKKELLEQIIIIADGVRKFQFDDGGFSANMPLNGYDSSITAIAGYFYSEVYRITNLDIYREISLKCVKKLMSVTRRNGAIDFSQGDTKGIGIYSVTYDIMPFTQGIALRIGDM